MVMYKGDAGYMTPRGKGDARGVLETRRRHRQLSTTRCADRIRRTTRRIVGGAKKHGETNFTLEADVPYTIADPAQPDHAGHVELHDQGRGVLPDDVGEVAADSRAGDGDHGGDAEREGTRGRSRAADLDLREDRSTGGQPYRAFVWMQGHNYANFTDPQIQPMLLRGIAWAAKQPIDALMTVKPPQRGRGGPGRGGPGGGQ